MKVSELIEKLKTFDPELTVTYSDAEYGTQVVYDVDIIEGSYVSGWHTATVLSLDGEYAEKKHFADKYFVEGKPPEYKPNPINDNLKKVYTATIDSRLKSFAKGAIDAFPVGGYITFPIHNKRDTE